MEDMEKESTGFGSQYNYQQAAIAKEEPVAEPSMPGPEPVVVKPVMESPVMSGFNNFTQSFASKTLVLQWLAYVSWWWFAAAATWLAGSVVNALIVGGKPSEFDSSTLAIPAVTMIVSLVAAVVVDTLYSRYEPTHTGRAARLLQSVHGVIFGVTILAILITIAYNLFGSAFGASYTLDGRNVTLATSFISLVLYTLVVVRVMFPAVKTIAKLVIMAIMAVIAIVLVAFALSGPAAKARDARDDSLLESALPALADKINQYANDKKRLPANLNDIDFNEDTESYSSYNDDKAKDIIKRDLVKYTANTGSSKQASTRDPYYSTSRYSNNSGDVYYYKLCVTYKTVKKSSYTYSSYYDDEDGDPTTTPSTRVHEKGEKCYNLMTTAKASSSPTIDYNYGAVLDELKAGTSTDKAEGATDTTKQNSINAR